jgi:antitoxin ParD1/3/4
MDVRYSPKPFCGMIDGMTTSKIAVSLPTPLLLRAQTAVKKGRAASMSAYVAAALTEQTTRDDLASLLDEMLDTTGGPLSTREMAAADRALGIGPSAPKHPTRNSRNPRRAT